MKNTNKKSKSEIIDVLKWALNYRNSKFNRKEITELWKFLMEEIQFFVDNQEEIFKEYDDAFAYRDYYDGNQEPGEMLKLKDTLEFCMFCLAEELEGYICILGDNGITREDKTRLLNEMSPRFLVWVKHARGVFDKRYNVNTKNENGNDENGNNQSGNDENDENDKDAKNDNGESVLPFEKKATKYRIFFAGHAFEDIKSLPQNVTYRLINKLSDTLAEEVLVKGSEGISRVKDKCRVPFFRKKFEYDYRIVYTRSKTSTIILGVTEKTGRDKDYAKYVIYAQRIAQIRKAAEEFCNGQSTEYNKMVYEYLREVYRSMRVGKKDVRLEAEDGVR